jgi:chitinase
LSESTHRTPARQRKLELLIALSAAVAAVGTLAPQAATAATVECQAWVSTIAYVAGDTAIRNGVSYKANWWTQNNDPATNNGGPGTGQPWTVVASCSGTPAPAPPPPTPAPPPPTPAPPPPTPAPPPPTPTPPPPAPTPPSPSPAPASGHWLIGYWHDFTNPSGNTYPISQVTNDWDVIIVAFANDAGSGNISFTVDPNAGTDAQFIADVAAKRKAGKKVVLSVGGQNGAISLDNATEVTNFVNSAYAIIQKYGFDGIDLDLETGVSMGAPIQTNIVTAMQQLKAKVGPTFYLSMAPEHPYVQGGYVAYGSIWGAYLPIIDALRNDLTEIHVQYYNNSSFTYDNASMQTVQQGTVDGLVAGSLMLIEGFTTAYGTGWHFNGLRPDQVAFGVPSGPSSANSGFVTPAVVANSLTCLTKLTNCGTIIPSKAYPTFRGVMTWSINWDKHDGYIFSVPTKADLNTLP